VNIGEVSVKPFENEGVVYYAIAYVAPSFFVAFYYGVFDVHDYGFFAQQGEEVVEDGVLVLDGGGED
jgi:hypothetical protein